jgi:hypothetical protein
MIKSFGRYWGTYPPLCPPLPTGVRDIPVGYTGYPPQIAGLPLTD